MIDPEQVKVARQWITSHWETGHFKDIFVIVKKSHMAFELGVNYGRFLELIKNPKGFKFEETYAMSKIIGVPASQISQLIHNQLDAPKSLGKRVKSI